MALLATAGFGGGRIYDGLVAATSRAAGASLLTRDRRALPVYELVGCTAELLA